MLISKEYISLVRLVVSDQHTEYFACRFGSDNCRMSIMMW